MAQGEPAAVRAAATLVAALGIAACTASRARYETLRAGAFAGPAPEPRARAAAAAETLPRLGQASQLSLDELIALARARNPTLSAMRAAWQAAVERYPQATALPDPRVGYALAPGTLAARGSRYGQRAELRQPLPWPGRLRLRGEAALAAAEAAADDFDDARLELVRAVKEAFHAYRFAHRAIAIQRADERLLAELERAAETRYAAGLASKSDALRAGVERQESVRRGLALERERAVARARINALLDLPAESPLPAPPERVAAPAPLPERARLEELALERRPELRALEHAVWASSSEVELARLESYPDLSVAASYNSLWEDPSKRTLVGLSLELPLQLERRRAAVRQALAERRRAVSRLAEARSRALLELSEAYEETLEASRVAHLYGSSILPAARESLETARSGYEAGADDFQTLLAAERALYSAELAYEAALTRYHQGLARLEHAVGGALDGEEKAP